MPAVNIAEIGFVTSKTIAGNTEKGIPNIKRTKKVILAQFFPSPIIYIKKAIKANEKKVTKITNPDP